MRAFLGIVVAVLLAGAGAAPASAAEWVEQRGWPVPRDGIADCLAVAGTGQLSALGPLGPSAPTQLLHAGDGLVPAGVTTLGWLRRCPAVAPAAGQPQLLAAPVYAPRERRWQLRVADAGGRPATLRSVGSADTLFAAVAAQAPSGAAAVAWYELSRTAGGRWQRRLALATRPLAGAPFGAPRIVARDTSGDAGSIPALGVDAGGSFTLAWQQPGIERRNELVTERATYVATVAADGTVGGAQQVTRNLNPEGVTLAVAADGRALLATSGPDDEMLVFERAPGAAAFAPVALPGGRRTDAQLALALAPDGGAVIADRAEPDTVVAWTRPPGGVFSRPHLLAGRLSHDSSGSWSVYLPEGRPTRPEAPGAAGPSVAAALAPDGSVLVTWVDPSDARSADAVRVARGTLAGGFGRAARLSGDCRTGDIARALTRADGTLAVAWTDNAAASRASSVDAQVRGGGRVHLAAPAPAGGGDLAGAAPRPPRPRPAALRRAGGPGLRVSAPLRLRVRCAGDAPCDVRATVVAENPEPPRDPAARPAVGDDPDGGEDGERHALAPLLVSDAIALRAHAGGELRLEPRAAYRIGRVGARSARVLVTTCSAGGAATDRRQLRVPIRATPPRPVPWLRDVRLRREGARLRLSWRTAAPAVRSRFQVVPYGPGYSWVRPAFQLAGRGRDRFEVAFRAPRRTVAVDLDVYTPEWNWGTDSAHVRVRSSG